MKTKRNWKAIVVMTILMILAIAANVHAAGISKKNLTLKKGQTATLTVKGAGKVTWKTSKKAVATVSSKGKVKAVAAGTAKITAKAGKKSYTCTVKVVDNTPKGSAKVSAQSEVLTASTAGMSAQEAGVYKRMYAMKSRFPEGKRWTNSDYYGWKAGIYAGGYGCAAFAFILSDAAFGDARARMHFDVSQIKVGDILRVDNNTHSVIVMKVTADGVIVAEGNYNNSIHWGRTISHAELKKSVNNIITRY